MASRLQEWRKQNPDKVRNQHLKQVYGITLEQYEEMHARQGGVCKICSRPERRKRNGVVRQLCVDHDHVTGRVRGLLCADCNDGLGKFNDNPELLVAAIDYIS